VLLPDKSGIQFYNQVEMFNAMLNSTDNLLKEETSADQGDLHDNIIR
jgi:hypothetical protein